MDFLLLLINIGAAATLLLWAVRMVRTGFERANGNAFRRAIQRSNSNRFKAAGVGILVGDAKNNWELEKNLIDNSYKPYLP